MNLFILRWNPAVSVYKKEQHVDLVNHIKNNEMPKNFNWSIHDYEKLSKDDMFILQQVGTKNDGIVMIGKFKGPCYEDDNWRDDGSEIHFADMWIMDAFDCDNENVLPATRYEKLFPKIEWHGGHSGILVEEEMDDDLINQIEADLIKAGIWKNGELDKFMAWEFESEAGPFLDESGHNSVNPEDFENGKILLEAKTTYLKNQDKDSFVNLIGCLIRSKVSMPMHVENDEEGRERCYPMVLTDTEGKNLFPVFSNEDQMGEHYQEDDCRLYQLTLPVIIDVIKEDKESSGILLDPFTTPFLIDRDLIKIISELKFSDGEQSPE